MPVRFQSLILFGSLCLGACGTDTSPVTDGAETGDSGGDVMTTSPATTGTVTVRSRPLSKGQVAAVMVADPDGAFLYTETVTERSVELTDVPVGGFVTLAIWSAGRAQLETSSDVRAGETIHFNEANQGDFSEDAIIGHLDVTLEDAGITHNSSVVYSPCGSTVGIDGLPASHRHRLWADCAEPSLHVVGVLRDDQNLPLALAYALDVPLTGAAPKRSGSVTLGDWTQDFGVLDVTYTTSLDTPDIVFLRGTAGRGPVLLQHGGDGGYLVGTTELSMDLAAEAPYVDKVAITLERISDSGAATSLTAWRVTDLPARGESRTLALTDADHAPMPTTIALNAEHRLGYFDVPPEWSCDGRGPNVVELRVSATHHSIGSWSWTLLAPHATRVAMPALDPLLEPELLQGLSYTYIRGRLHSAPVEFHDLGPSRFWSTSEWLFETGANGPVCSSTLRMP